MIERRSVVRAVVLGFGLAGAAAPFFEGCRRHPRDGDACTIPWMVTCTGDVSAFVCNRGVLSSVACRGGRGCSAHDGIGACDDSVADIGDPCVAANGGTYACSPDAGLLLACANGHFVEHRACRGEGRCVPREEEIACDDSVAEVGDRCADGGPSTYVCAVDGRSVLQCTDGVWRLARACLGPRGCMRSAGHLRVASCDESLAELGGACRGDLIACSTDRTLELECRNGKFESRRECHRTGCAVRGDEITCD